MFKLKVEHEDVLYLEYSGNREGVNNRYRSYSSQGTCSTLQVQLLVQVWTTMYYHMSIT